MTDGDLDKEMRDGDWAGVYDRQAARSVPVSRYRDLLGVGSGDDVLHLGCGPTLHPVQQAFWDKHGLQCGYCTPGFVINSVALLEERDNPSVTEIQEHLSGNICRCTGYTKIVESVQHAADVMDSTDEENTRDR